MTEPSVAHSIPVLPDPPIDQLLRAVRECAEDLASIKDRTVVLRGVVRRTRQLLQTDMAYLSRNDLGAGETFIFVTDGVRTPAYQSIRMSLGTGLLGAVAAGGSPVQTADYLADPEMNHLDYIDKIVHGEGVKAILGTPLRVGGKVVGALLVAHRSPLKFSPTAVQALVDLAAQASIAFEHTRLTSKLNQLINTQSSTQTETVKRQRELEDMLRLDERLMGSLVPGAGLEGIVDVLTEEVGHSVSIYDPAWQLLAGSAVFDGEVLRPEHVMAAAEASRHGRGATGVRQATETLVIAAASAGEEHLATLVSQGGPKDRTVLERASVFVSTLILFERTLIDADNRAQSELISDLVSPHKHNDPTLMSRLADYGIHGAKGLDVLVGEVDPDVGYAALTAVRSVLYQGLFTLHSGHICIITDSARSSQTLATRLLTTLNSRNITALIGHTHASEVEGVGNAHSRALAIIAAQQALGRTNAVANVTDLGLAGIVVAGAHPAHIAELIDRFVGPLISYDQTHHSELTLTAWCYLEHGGKLTPTAAYLHIHPNTVRQRAERISGLLGATWRTPPHSVDLHFALRLWRLQSTR
ncbi:GAF domain-containing protein [Jonesiaceae bacterium BS-20]|uniref:GAF domain-containing protein n=1 Tax=Jonesiaceae bacterium BS-20 TaxID=3120821 RepID=A0AAU7DVD1_9MICO